MNRAIYALTALVLTGCPAPPVPMQFDPHDPTPRVRVTDDPNRPLAEPYSGTRPASDPHHRPDAHEVGAPDYTPREECDGDDDDGDGRVDEGWVEPERPDGEDQDCDGVPDNGTLGWPCGKDRDCAPGLYCGGGRCAASCAEELDACNRCVAFMVLGDDDMMDPVGCNEACVARMEACADVGGFCDDGQCRRWPTIGCFEGQQEIEVQAVYVVGDRVETIDMGVCW